MLFALTLPQSFFNFQLASVFALRGTADHPNGFFRNFQVPEQHFVVKPPHHLFQTMEDEKKSRDQITFFMLG